MLQAYLKIRDKEHKSLSMLYLFIICAVILAADIFLQQISHLMLLQKIALSENPDCYKDIYIIITRFLELILAKVMVIIIRRNKIERIDSYECIGSFILPVFSVIFIYTLSYFLSDKLNIISLILFNVSLLLVIALNLYFTWVFEAMSKAGSLENERRLYEEQAKLQHSYYEDLKNKYEESRKVIHDIRAHIQTLEQLYSVQDASIAAQYTNDLNTMLSHLGETYYTDNKVLNLIMNDKVHKMKSLGIEEDIRIGEMDMDFIREIDITTIFTNLFDNAVTAAITAERKYIKLRMEKFNDMISICIENSYKEPLLPLNKGFGSIKKNHEGLGLKNIERTLKKYEGDIRYEYNQDTFIVYIMIPAY